MKIARCNYEGGHTWRWMDDIPGGCWECATCQEKVSGSPDQMPVGEEGWMGLADLAQVTGLHHDQLRRAARDGRLHAHKWGGSWISSVANIRAALDNGRLQHQPGRPVSLP